MVKKKRSWSRNININIILILTFIKSVLQDIKTYHNTTVGKKKHDLMMAQECRVEKNRKMTRI